MREGWNGHLSMNLKTVKEGKPALNLRNSDCPTTLTWPAATLSRSRGRGVRLLPGEIRSVALLAGHAAATGLRHSRAPSEGTRVRALQA